MDKADTLLICHTFPATGYVSIVSRVTEQGANNAPEPVKVFHRYRVGDRVHYESSKDPMNMQVGVIEKLSVIDVSPLAITYLVNDEWIAERAIWKLG